MKNPYTVNMLWSDGAHEVIAQFVYEGDARRFSDGYIEKRFGEPTTAMMVVTSPEGNIIAVYKDTRA